MKKKRQSEPCGDIDNESTESCEDNQNKTGRSSDCCDHILKSICQPKTKKALKGGLDVDCSECAKEGNSKDTDNGDFEYDLSLWLCLRCGHQACGRNRRQHALKHFHTPHSDCHALCVNTTTWIVWCYECDREIQPKTKRGLLEIYEYIKKQSQAVSKMNNPVSGVAIEKPLQIEEKQFSASNKIIESLPRLRGLSNLGNTCFFNAVLQCLARTPFLVPVLKEMSEEGEKFRLPGGTFKFKDKTEDLPPIEGELASWGALTETLANTLTELQSSGGVVNAKALLRLLASKQPQFGVGDQEDSHELLRHLLEAVRAEDLKRYQRVILQETKIPLKSNPASIDEETTQKVKFYGLQASDMILRPEQVFRGVLVSTLQCQDCLHTSTREESFLDLSLPIMPDKPQPPIMRRKSELDEDKQVSASKHQLKKEKKLARKLAKEQNKINKASTINEENNTSNAGNNSSEQSDADIEDNLEDVTKVLSTPDEDKSEKVDSPEKVRSDDVNQINDMNLKLSDIYRDYNHHNHQATNPTADLQELTDRLTAGSVNISDEKLPPQQIHSVSRNVSPNSSECSDLSSPDNPNAQTTESRNDISPDDSTSGVVNKLNSSPDGGDNNKVTSPAGVAPTTLTPGGWYAAPWHNNVDIFSSLPPAVPEDNRNSYYTPSPSTIGARYQCDDSECSVQSCLNQFTSVELMTGNNKVCCEACTKRINGKDGGKNVYTNSTKQLLIAMPPAVLILHLKRFQVFRSLFRKMSKPVTFPLILDLAPFCSNKCKNLPTINNQQNRILYSLYGVVEHSGTLHGGHYVAYVKVRPPLDENSYRCKFLPRIGSKKYTNHIESEEKSTKPSVSEDDVDDGASGVSDPKPPPGKWYYVSDSQVSEVQESQVLKVQAYLLFYERIL
ncbi:ubiquitin carboxyl-terminal hydrolase 45 [Chrysoperla carnea]|uniref:ubiquitin carboxyl-terminal hydrolase 45 n=1 Tax=Chrysoperla carnea TaxID=189513 RepID=UPI001D08E8F8|nr:ubiquitin carboxyl-terminal hydrolase 45 [Chrysoperla carnea]